MLRQQTIIFLYLLCKCESLVQQNTFAVHHTTFTHLTTYTYLNTLKPDLHCTNISSDWGLRFCHQPIQYAFRGSLLLRLFLLLTCHFSPTASATLSSHTFIANRVKSWPECPSKYLRSVIQTNYRASLMGNVYFNYIF